MHPSQHSQEARQGRLHQPHPSPAGSLQVLQALQQLHRGLLNRNHSPTKPYLGLRQDTRLRNPHRLRNAQKYQALQRQPAKKDHQLPDPHPHERTRPPNPKPPQNTHQQRRVSHRRNEQAKAGASPPVHALDPGGHAWKTLGLRKQHQPIAQPQPDHLPGHRRSRSNDRARPLQGVG